MITDLQRWTDAYPGVEWARPIHVITEHVEGFLCRVCIAEQGLRGSEVEKRAMSYGDAVAHIEREHS